MTILECYLPYSSSQLLRHISWNLPSFFSKLLTQNTVFRLHSQNLWFLLRNQTVSLKQFYLCSESNTVFTSHRAVKMKTLLSRHYTLHCNFSFCKSVGDHVRECVKSVNYQYSQTCKADFVGCNWEKKAQRSMCGHSQTHASNFAFIIKVIPEAARNILGQCRFFFSPPEEKVREKGMKNQLIKVWGK